MLVNMSYSLRFNLWKRSKDTITLCSRRYSVAAQGHSSDSATSFPSCGSELDHTSPSSKNNFTRNTELYKKHDEILSNMPLSSTRKGVLSVPDRIAALKDTDAYCLQLSQFAGMNMPYGKVPQANTLNVITKISGHPCIITANNGSFKGGTMYPITVKKSLRSHQIAEQNRIPCIYLVDSGGAYLPLQVSEYPFNFLQRRITTVWLIALQYIKQCLYSV